MCKRDVDDVYMENFNEKSYKDRTYKDWKFPKKYEKYTIHNIWNMSNVIGIKLPKDNNFIEFKDLLCNFSDMPHLKLYIWDWFYTEQELRKQKLDNIQKQQLPPQF